MKLKRMECPGCGASVDIREGFKYGICAYCGTKVFLETNSYEFVFRDEAKLRELELQEESRKRHEEKQQIEKQRNDLINTLSILTSDDAGNALKSVGKLAMRFLKNNM